MSLPHRSVATIEAPEFINLQPLDINPMMSKCEIKVFYVGENRNGSFIKKEVAAEMAKTLRGAPIVGYYKDSKDDFTDHGHVVTIDDEGVHFQEMTRPYGFVAPNADVWFQKFMDEDAFGNQVEREYLMTTGYLWTGQYQEARSVLESGKPQSMELDGDSLKGDWAENSKTGMSFFIINDAIVSKLCILGDDTEPCFEGASVTKPEISASFSLDDKFKNTLFNMMKELEFALKGEHTVTMENVTVNEPIEQDEIVEEFVREVQDSTEDISNSSDFAKEDDEKDAEEAPDEEDKDKKDDEDFVKQVDDSAEAHTEKRELGKDTAAILEHEPEEESEPEGNENNVPVQNSLHSDEEYEALEAKYFALEAEYEKLVEFKNQIEDAQKDALIEKFFMLSDEDKKDVIENKRSYSLDDIEAKLAVICYRKKVNFDLIDSDKNEKEETDTVVTFDLKVNDSTPDWIRAVEDMQSKI